MRSAICWGLASKGCKRQLLLSRFHSRFHLRFQFVLRSAQVTCGDSRGPTNLHFYNPSFSIHFSSFLQFEWEEDRKIKKLACSLGSEYALSKNWVICVSWSLGSFLCSFNFKSMPFLPYSWPVFFYCMLWICGYVCVALSCLKYTDTLAHCLLLVWLTTEHDN